MKACRQGSPPLTIAQANREIDILQEAQRSQVGQKWHIALLSIQLSIVKVTMWWCSLIRIWLGSKPTATVKIKTTQTAQNKILALFTKKVVALKITNRKVYSRLQWGKSVEKVNCYCRKIPIVQCDPYNIVFCRIACYSEIAVELSIINSTL